MVEVKCNKPKIVKPIRTGNGIKKTKVSALNILGRGEMEIAVLILSEVVKEIIMIFL